MSVIRDHLRDGLTRAMRARDAELVAAHRSALAALDNATAVPGRAGDDERDGALEQTAVGAGATDVVRREVEEAAERDLVRAEAAELRAGSAYRPEPRAAAMRRAADALDEVAGPAPADGRE